ELGQGPQSKGVVGRLGIVVHEASEASHRGVAVLFEVHATAQKARRLDERPARPVAQDLARLGQGFAGTPRLLGQDSQLEAGRVSGCFVGEVVYQLLEELFAASFVAS